MSPIDRRVGIRDMVAYLFKEDEELGDLEENLQHLTVGILDVATDDLPRCYQHHTVEISGQFSKLLCRVA